MKGNFDIKINYPFFNLECGQKKNPYFELTFVHFTRTLFHTRYRVLCVPSMQISYRVRKYCFFYCYTHELPIDITVLPLYTIPGCMTLLLHQLRKCGPSYLLAIAS